MPANAVAESAGRLARISVDPEIGRPGTENYSGYIQSEWVGELRDGRGHGTTGATPGEYEQLAKTDPLVEAMLTALVDPVVDASAAIEGPDEDINSFLEENLFDWLE